MEEKELFRKVGDILKELNDQYSHLSKAGDDVNELEIELFVANASFLADHIRIIQKIKNTEAPQAAEQKVVDLMKERVKAEEKPGKVKQPEKEAEPEESPVTAEHQQNKEPKAETPKPSEEIKFDFSQQEEEPSTPEQHPEEIKEPEPAEEEVVVHEVVIREKTVSVDTSVADKDHIPTVNDLLSANASHNTLSGKYNRQPAGDLKSMINLNDKLIFVKDLFNGYSLAYSEAIELLNRFDNFEAADNFLKKNYAMKNNWSEKQITVDKLYEILNRRFTK